MSPSASFLTVLAGHRSAVDVLGESADEVIARALDEIRTWPHEWRTFLAVTPAVYPAMWWIIAFDTGDD